MLNKVIIIPFIMRSTKLEDMFNYYTVVFLKGDSFLVLVITDHVLVIFG